MLTPSFTHNNNKGIEIPKSFSPLFHLHPSPKRRQWRKKAATAAIQRSLLHLGSSHGYRRWSRCTDVAASFLFLFSGGNSDFMDAKPSKKPWQRHHPMAAYMVQPHGFPL
ncbi:hypothetical protein Lal_00033520 [Lupinus albus]|uniref:Uncharacterized protein n=1 Tax=Lupinus albus TaxID=3870 RepID=A0A6A4NF52_LUPAL|nr:hypothetical protein Lalb_Chr19g0128031 [Lupinus albus]KAF1884347.1 hypothetical protein Lal_00033520 [Lupinus albus]